MVAIGREQQYCMVNGCQNLLNLTVTLQVTEDLVTWGNKGFSLQLNSYPQPGQTCQGEPLDWFQYIIYVLDGQLSWEIQYWANAKSYSDTMRWPPGYAQIRQIRHRGCPVYPTTTCSLRSGRRRQARFRLARSCRFS